MTKIYSRGFFKAPMSMRTRDSVVHTLQTSCDGCACRTLEGPADARPIDFSRTGLEVPDIQNPS